MFIAVILQCVRISLKILEKLNQDVFQAGITI